MITKFITNVSVKFDPFKRSDNACRFFLAQLPANARTTMKISTTILPRNSQEESMLYIKLSKSLTPTYTIRQIFKEPGIDWPMV